MSPVLATAELDKKHWHSIELGCDRQTGSAIVYFIYFIYSGTSFRADLGTPFLNIYQNLVIENLDFLIVVHLNSFSGLILLE